MSGCNDLSVTKLEKCRSRWPHGLRCRSVAAHLLRLWVRIPSGVWMSVVNVVLSGRGLCDELITHLEESYRLWCVVVFDLETSWKRRPWPTGTVAPNKENWNKNVSLRCIFYCPSFSSRTFTIKIAHIVTKKRLLCATRAVHNSGGWNQTCRSTFDTNLAHVKFVVNKVGRWQILQLVLLMASVNIIPSSVRHRGHTILATVGVIKQHAKSSLLDCIALPT
jgi:hypothetical protein